jgi:uncharacterized membrane protein YdbT with pleckstrin-like domain
MTTTIQKTSKNIKAHIVASIFVVAIGIGLTVNGYFEGPILFVVGLVWLICAKIAKWWNHD